MKIARKWVNSVVEILLESEAVKATKYVAPNLIVRAVRRSYKYSGKRKLPRKGHNIEITLTIGKPNYAEKEFIKKCEKSKEPFPVKKIQLKFLK